MIAAGKNEFRLASENLDCLAGDSSASSDPISISPTVVPLRIDGINGMFFPLPRDHPA